MGSLMKIQCDECNTIHAVSPDFIFENVDSQQREMGVEIEKNGEYAFNCDSCKNDITIKKTIWEYPAGIYNNEEIEIHGGRKADSQDG